MVSLDEFVKAKLHTENRMLIADCARGFGYHHYKRGDCILESEEKIPALYYLASDGIVRRVYHTVNGKEITDGIYCGVGTCVMPGAKLAEPSRVELQALTDVRLLELPMAELHRLQQKYPETRRLVEDAVMEYWRMQVEIKRMRYEYDATGRYQWFCKTFPQAAGRVMYKHVATFLDMTPVQLSRVRRQIVKQEAK